MKQDKTIERIRKVRHEISKKFDHNPRKLVEHYIKMQARHKSRTVLS